MKFKQFLALTADADGFIPTPRLRWIIQKNTRPTAREEAIAAKVLEAANPRENISSRFPWSPEEQMVLQQMWVHEHPLGITKEWRDVPIKGAEELYSVEQTEHGELPVPNVIKEPGQVRGDFRGRLEEILGETERRKKRPYWKSNEETPDTQIMEDADTEDMEGT